jgi:UDP-N-acetylmuramate dehydrogenase
MNQFDELANRLRAAMRGPVRRNAPLRDICRWKIGGPAQILVEPTSSDDLAAALVALSDYHGPRIVIGDGSNLLFDDRGVDGVVIRMGQAMSRMTIDHDQVWAEAGIWVPHFVRRVGCSGLTGAEHAIGIPGTLGGLVLMNGGSQRKGIGENVVSVRCMGFDGELVELSKADCAFSYRHSVLQTRELIVLDASFAFASGNAATIRHEMIDIMASRRKKFPKNLPNCGSVFLSNPAMYNVVGAPGFAIEQTGLKGERRGNAQISPLHANFIVNLGMASSDDVLYLIHQMRSRVLAATGFAMDCEVRHVAPNGTMRMAHEPAAEMWADTALPVSA